MAPSFDTAYRGWYWRWRAWRTWTPVSTLGPAARAADHGRAPGVAGATGCGAVPLRRDLVTWLRRRAATTGEPLEAVADRAVAAYRRRLDPEPRHRTPT